MSNGWHVLITSGILLMQEQENPENTGAFTLHWESPNPNAPEGSRAVNLISTPGTELHAALREFSAAITRLKKEYQDSVG